MTVARFLDKSKVETAEDYALQVELWAYIIAKHFGISLLEVYAMPQDIFTQSLVWAAVMDEEKKNETQRAKQQARSNGNETVRLDYSSILDR